MIQKIESYIKKYHMIEAGDHIIAGVSGGADSICMLLILLELMPVLGHTVSVLHVEHGIRGEDSVKDAVFVQDFCKKHGITCRVCRYSVPEYAAAHGMSEEEAGRHLRYTAFEDEKKIYLGRNVKIAVAHHLGDHAETMLFHLARGTGISGLSGIAPVRGDIIRPLLRVSRKEIEEYLSKIGQDFCVDVTNEMDTYSRNRIRHNVMPALEQVNEKAAEHMYLAAEQLREIDDYIKCQAADLVKKSCTIYQDENGAMINKEIFESQASGSHYWHMGAMISKGMFECAHPVLQKEMLYQLLVHLSGSSRDLTREHIVSVQQLFAKQNGRQVHLPYGLIAVRVYEGVEIFHMQKMKGKNRRNCKRINDGREDSGKDIDREDNKGDGVRADIREESVSEGRTGRSVKEGKAGKNVGEKIVRDKESVNEESAWDNIRENSVQDQFSFRLIENISGDIPQISKKKYTKCFDYDKIKVGFCVRSRQPGDYLAVNAAGDRQKLKKYLVNEKIPVKEREQLMLLADGAHIMWVVGHRISSYYKVDEHTRRILEVTFYGGEEDE